MRLASPRRGGTVSVRWPMASTDLVEAVLFACEDALKSRHDRVDEQTVALLISVIGVGLVAAAAPLVAAGGALFLGWAILLLGWGFGAIISGGLRLLRARRRR
jgi:hypothetical protein